MDVLEIELTAEMYLWVFVRLAFLTISISLFKNLCNGENKWREF